jgi:hypothetical protein
MKSLIDEFLAKGYPKRLRPTRDEFESALVAWWFVNQDNPARFQAPNCIEEARRILYGRTIAFGETRTTVPRPLERDGFTMAYTITQAGKQMLAEVLGDKYPQPEVVNPNQKEQ